MREPGENEKIIHLLHDIKKKTFLCLDNLKNTTDLTMLQIRILNVIRENKEITMSFLSELMEVKPASMTSQINILVNQRYLSRKNDKIDRRIVRVKLTNKGENVYESIHAKKLRILKKMFIHMTKDEKRQIINLLEKLDSSISQI